MKKLLYTTLLLLAIVVLGQALSSTSKKVLVLPPDQGELNLPDIPFDYSPDIPQHVDEFIVGWGSPNIGTLSAIDDHIATLGRVLFYDDRLSDDNTLSCASCHQQAFAFSDDKVFSEGIGDNITTRNTMPLNDLAWQVGQSFFWDFRSASLNDAVLQPILNTHELGKQMPDLINKLEAADVYRELFENAYGDDEITQERITNSLAEFINSMVSFESKFDQHVAGSIEFTESESLGLELFNGNCGFCHVTPHMGVTDPFGFFPGGNNGLDSVFVDLGMGGWTGDSFLNGVFRAPSLRSTAVTGPYMHDGRFETLEDVIDFYSEDVIPNEGSVFNWIFGEDFTGYGFSDEEKINLLAFLKTLTDENLLTNEKWSNPWSGIATSLQDFTLKGISVYPNPIEDHLIIELNNSDRMTYNINIIDAQGRIVQSFETNDQQLNISRGNFPAGVYELQATAGTQQKTFKVIYQ